MKETTIAEGISNWFNPAWSVVHLVDTDVDEYVLTVGGDSLTFHPEEDTWQTLDSLIDALMRVRTAGGER